METDKESLSNSKEIEEFEEEMAWWASSVGQQGGAGSEGERRESLEGLASLTCQPPRTKICLQSAGAGASP